MGVLNQALVVGQIQAVERQTGQVQVSDPGQVIALALVEQAAAPTKGDDLRTKCVWAIIHLLGG